MRNIILFWVCLLCVFGLGACHDKAKEYKDLMREGAWYVYDIDLDYKFYSFMTPELKRYVRYLMDEKNLLFLPGDEITFSSKQVNVRTPGNRNFSYRYYFEGRYIQVGDYDIYYGLKPDGDNDWLNLEFDKSSLRQFLYEQGEEALLDQMDNLKNFHITYLLQRPMPLVAQIMSGIYVGELYDGTQQLVNAEATLNLFWEDGRLNLSMDEPISLQDGPKFYLEIPDLATREGFTPGSYEFTGSQVINDGVYGEVQIQLNGRYNATETVSMDVSIRWNNLTYQLNFVKGVRYWGVETVSQTGKSILLKAVVK